MSSEKKVVAGLKKAGVAVTLMAVGCGVAWASCGGTEVLVSSAVAATAAALEAAVSAAGAEIVSNENFQTQRITGALKVLTEQVNTSAQQSNNSALQAEQAGASVMVDLANKRMIDKAIEDYSSQGYNPCAQLTATQAMATAEATARANVPARIQTEVQAGGGKYADPAATLSQREQQHRALFCTQADVDAGLCSSVGAIPGGDSNASLIFSTDTSANMIAAKNAAINNIIGVPDAPLPASVAQTPAGAAYVMAKKEKDSFLAFSAYSLKSIQTDAEQFDAFMNERVGQYFGTSAAQDWAQDQASESQRGVLVDLVRIEGLALKLGERQLRQNLRREANDAATLVAENNRINGAKTDAAATRAIAAQMASKVTQ